MPTPSPKPGERPEALKELAALIKDALERMSLGRLHSGPVMETADFKAIAQTALERFVSLESSCADLEKRLKAQATKLMWADRLVGCLDSLDAAQNDDLLKDDPLARTLLRQGIHQDIDECLKNLRPAPPAKEETT